MSFLSIGVIFLFAVAATLSWGAGTALAVVYLPVVILLNMLREMALPGVPDIGAGSAVIYGIMLASVPRIGESMGIRLNLVDGLILALTGSAMITSMITEHLYTAVSTAGSYFLTFVGPYFLARVAFVSPRNRERALWGILFCLPVLVLFALIEVRFWPHFYMDLLSRFKIYQEATDVAMRRYGFFRAQVSFAHPIDFGNASVILLGMVYALAGSTKVGLRNTTVRAALLGLLVCALTSLSFTSYIALAALGAIFFTMRWFRLARTMLVSGVILGIVGGVMVTGWFLTVNPNSNDDAGALEGSVRNRALIIQSSLDKAKSAGPFGFGSNLSQEELGIESVDNTYLLLIMRQGWVYIAMWLAIPLVLAWRGGRALKRCMNGNEQRPVIGALATIFAMMVAMYTVWFGFTYALLWMVALGLAVTLVDVCLERSPVRQPMQARGMFRPRNRAMEALRHG